MRLIDREMSMIGFFYIFSIGLIASALMVVFLKNPVHCALSLVLSFLFSACLWLLLEAEFLALVLVLVYVGAVMTLFLFVVMTINLDIEPKYAHFVRYFPIGLALMAALAIMLIYAFNAHPFGLNLMIPHGVSYSNTESLGAQLYTQYAYPFEISGALLLVAIIAAISLNPLGPRRRKTQIIAKQVDIDPKQCVRIIPMATEKQS